MAYTPFKMRSSPMKRNFGIGEKEEVSPGKLDKSKIISGIGDILQAGVDAGAGTSYQKEKEAAREAKKTKAEKEKEDELKHKRELEKINQLQNPSKTGDGKSKDNKLTLLDDDWKKGSILNKTFNPETGEFE